MSRAPRDIRSATPELGEHTDEILADPDTTLPRSRNSRESAVWTKGSPHGRCRGNAKPDAAPGTMHVRKENGIGWMVYDQQAKYNAVTHDMRAPFPESATSRRTTTCGPRDRRRGDKAFISGSDISQFGEKRSSEEARRMYDEASQQANLAMRTETDDRDDLRLLSGRGRTTAPAISGLPLTMHNLVRRRRSLVSDSAMAASTIW